MHLYMESHLKTYPSLCLGGLLRLLDGTAPSPICGLRAPGVWPLWTGGRLLSGLGRWLLLDGRC